MSKLQEIRFAVVMYGGVSLCIYINGVAQELHRLVRSTSGADLSDDPVAQIYQRISLEIADLQNPSSGKVLPTRFVVDLLSGTSAGGINAVFLAKALATRSKNLNVLRDTWLRVADMAELLNSKVEPFSSKRSLLRGNWMYEQLYQAFNQMDKEESDPALNYSQAREIDLFVTCTDLNGVETPLRLSDREISERIHKGCFHFRFDSEVLPENKADSPLHLNQFGRAFNPLLAFAARCTSSFPIAFEPMKLANIKEALEADKEATISIDKVEETFRSFFRWIPDRDGGLPLMQRPLADGGYLDNKPFGYVIDALTYRATSLPHARKLLFVDPFPEPPEGRPEKPHINFLANAALAAMELPRYETIRGDIERIHQGNQSRQKLKTLQAELNQQLKDAAPDRQKSSGEAHVEGQAYEMAQENSSGAETPASRASSPYGFKQPLSKMIKKYGAAYGTYHIIRLDKTTDYLARTLAQISGTTGQEDLYFAIRYITTEWRKESYSPEGGDGLMTESEFLTQFDFSFRLRLAIDLIHASIAECDEPARLQLITILTRIRRCARRLSQGGAQSPLYNIFKDFHGLSWQSVKSILHQPSEAARIEEARRIYKEHATAIDALAGAIQAEWRPVWLQNYIEVKALRKEFPQLHKHYSSFDFRDMLSLTYLEGSDVQDHANVDIHRISPAEGVRLSENRTKLAGYALAAFGAFLYRPWRENDILWGRLDTAEQLVHALLPPGQNRDDKVNELHLAIIRQEAASRQGEDLAKLADFAKLSPEALRPALVAGYRVPPPPPNHQLVDQASQAARILGTMIEDDLGQPGAPAGALKTIGGGIAGVLCFLIPTSLWFIFTQYWLQLFGALGLTLWLSGSYLPSQLLSESAGILLASFGRSILLTCIALWVIFQLLGGFLVDRGAPSNWFLRQLRWVLVFAIAIPFGVGLWKLPEFWQWLQALLLRQ